MNLRCCYCGEGHYYAACAHFDGCTLSFYFEFNQCEYAMQHREWHSATIQDVLRFVFYCSQLAPPQVALICGGREIPTHNHRTRCCDVRVFPGALIFVVLRESSCDDYSVSLEHATHNTFHEHCPHCLLLLTHRRAWLQHSRQLLEDAISVSNVEGVTTMAVNVPQTTNLTPVHEDLNTSGHTTVSSIAKVSSDKTEVDVSPTVQRPTFIAQQITTNEEHLQLECLDPPLPTTPTAPRDLSFDATKPWADFSVATLCTPLPTPTPQDPPPPCNVAHALLMEPSFTENNAAAQPTLTAIIREILHVSVPQENIGQQEKHRNAVPGEVRTTVHIKFVPLDVSEEDIRHFLSSCGTVRKVRYIKPLSLAAGCFAVIFAEFADEDAAASLIQRTGVRWGQFRLKISFAKLPICGASPFDATITAPCTFGQTTALQIPTPKSKTDSREPRTTSKKFKGGPEVNVAKEMPNNKKVNDAPPAATVINNVQSAYTRVTKAIVRKSL